jgi:hypothetical protein
VLAAPATIAAAVMTAGGLARSRRMWASGALTIRRPQANKEEQVWQYDMIEQPISEWGQFELQAGDLVMLEWHIEER